MATISFTIPNAATNTRIKTAFKNLHPIPQIDDPNWIDPEDESVAPKINEYTESDWVKKKIIDYVKHSVKRIEEFDAKKAVQDVNVDDIIS